MKNKYVFIGLVLVFTLSFLIETMPLANAWWNSSWSYRRPFIVNITGSRPDYQVRLNLTYDTEMDGDFHDIRFIDSTDTYELPFWEEDRVNGNWATYYIKGNWSGTGTQGYIYYAFDQPSLITSTSNGDNTFIFFDNFESGNLNKWTSYSGGSISSTVYYQGSYSASINGVAGIVKTVTGGKVGYMLNLTATNKNFFVGAANSYYFVFGEDTGTSTANHSVYQQTEGAYRITNETINTRWKRVLMVQNNSYSAVYIDDKITPVYQFGSSSSFDQFKAYATLSDTTIYVDNVFVAKYQRPEPITAFGDEEVYVPPTTTTSTSTTSTTTTTIPPTTTLLVSNGTTNVEVFLNKYDFIFGYCVDDNTLALNTTDTVWFNGTVQQATTQQLKECEFGCESILGICRPSYVIMALLSFALIWIFSFVITNIIFIIDNFIKRSRL